MRYVLMFDDKGVLTEVINFSGAQLNPDDEFEKLNITGNYKRTSKEMLVEIIGVGWSHDQLMFVELVDGELIFNQGRYEQSLQELEGQE